MHLVELIPCKGTEAALLDQLEDLPRLHAGQGRGARQGHAQLHRQPHRRVLDAGHQTSRAGVRPRLRHGGCADRPLSRPPQERHLPHAGRGRPRCVRACGQHHAREPHRRSVAQAFRVAGLVQVPGRSGRAGAEDQARHLPEDRQGNPRAGPAHADEYRLSDAKVDDGVKDILRERDWAKKLAGLRANQHPQAQFLWAVFRDVFHYCALHLEDIADNARDLDFAVRWGFGWDSGPFEIWQAAGWQQVAGWIAADIAAGKAMADAPLPAWVTDPARTGVHTAQGSYLALPQQEPMQTRAPHSPSIAASSIPDRLLGEDRAIRRDRVRDRRRAPVAHRRRHRHPELQDQDAHHQQRSAGRHAARGGRGRSAFHRADPVADRAAVLRRRQPAATDAGRAGDAAQHAGMFGKLKGAVSRVKYTVAGGGGMGDMLNAATGNVPHVEDVVAKFQQVSHAPQIRAGAHHRGGGWPGARRRLRILHPLHAHRRHAGKLHRPGRSRRRPAARRRIVFIYTVYRLTGSNHI